MSEHVIEINGGNFGQFVLQSKTRCWWISGLMVRAMPHSCPEGRSDR